VAESFDLVEILPDERVAARDFESLGHQPRVLLPRLGRLPASIQYLALIIAVLGCVLASDSTPVRETAAAPVAPAAAPYEYGGDSHCPVGVRCSAEGRPRQDMWASYNRLFTGTRAVGGGVWYEARSGDVYYQELDAVSLTSPGLSITLREQRIDRNGTLVFGPTIDFVQRARFGVPPFGLRAMIVTARRGPWLVTAALNGPRTGRLPLDAALEWTRIAPLPG
jgi:hypothetical protein